MPDRAAVAPTTPPRLTPPQRTATRAAAHAMCRSDDEDWSPALRSLAQTARGHAFTTLRLTCLAARLARRYHCPAMTVCRLTRDGTVIADGQPWQVSRVLRSDDHA